LPQQLPEKTAPAHACRLQVDVIDSRLAQLREAIAGAKDFMAADAAHRDYVDSLVIQTFLDLKQLMQIVEAIFSACTRLSALVQVRLLRLLCCRCCCCRNCSGSAAAAATLLQLLLWLSCGFGDSNGRDKVVWGRCLLSCLACLCGRWAVWEDATRELVAHSFMEQPAAGAWWAGLFRMLLQPAQASGVSAGSRMPAGVRTAALSL
jgi:hypothetical protein